VEGARSVSTASSSFFEREPKTPQWAVSRARGLAKRDGKPHVVYATAGGLELHGNNGAQVPSAPAGKQVLDVGSAWSQAPGGRWEVVYHVSPTGLERPMGKWIKFPWAVAEAERARLAAAERKL
jgi:hypothetical protein